MKRLLLLVAISMAATISAFAQRSITGKIVEGDSKEPMAMTTVQLLRQDSTVAAGVLTAENGNFKVKAPADGRYILKVTSVGFKSYIKNLTVDGGKDVPLGTIEMAMDAIMLKGAVATGHAAKVTTKEDTFVYNAAAYRTPEGSVVEELVKRLPGAQMDDDGNIGVHDRRHQDGIEEPAHFHH